MYKKNKEIKVDQDFKKLELLFYETEDWDKLKDIFENWLKLSEMIKEMGGRGLNIPEDFTEAVFCLEMRVARVIKGHKCDTINLQDKVTQQIKATSIEDDCTSFSPDTKSDEMFFMDFYGREGLDGTYDIYEIPIDKLKSTVVNTKKGETFKDQQKQGRRPRLSLFDKIIDPNDLKPIKSGGLYEEKDSAPRVEINESLDKFT